MSQSTISRPKAAIYHPELYFDDTPLVLIRFFERRVRCIRRNMPTQHYRFHYGQVRTGRSWGDTAEGFVRLSAGKTPHLIVCDLPLAAAGPRIMLNSIVKVENTAKNSTIYRHPYFHTHNTKASVFADEGTDTREARRIRIRPTSDNGDTDE